MNPAASKLLEQADWSVLGPELLRFADGVIRRYYWRGFRPLRTHNMICANGVTADDFIQDAVIKLVDGRRTWRDDLSVEQNIKRTVESDINSHSRKSRHRKLVDRSAAEAAEFPEDPLDELPESDQPENAVEAMELLARQKEMYEAFLKHIESDDDLTSLALAYDEGKFKPAEIAIATGLIPERISELKRKLSSRANKFLESRPEFADLRPEKGAK